MTFEFSPDWMEGLLDTTAYSPVSPLAAAQIPPPHPDARTMAALLGELFAEGTLSAEQFRSMLTSPEMEPFRDSTLLNRLGMP